jgi:hypothetical protein
MLRQLFVLYVLLVLFIATVSAATLEDAARAEAEFTDQFSLNSDFILPPNDLNYLNGLNVLNY